MTPAEIVGALVYVAVFIAGPLYLLTRRAP